MSITYDVAKVFGIPAMTLEAQTSNRSGRVLGNCGAGADRYQPINVSGGIDGESREQEQVQPRCCP